MSVVYPGSDLADKIAEIYHFTYHVSDIFPADTDETVTVTAGGTANTFGAWAAVVDNNAVELSTVFAAEQGHITAISIEDASRTDERYLLEVSYGAAKVVVVRSRFMKMSLKVDVNHKVFIRSIHVPAGETVYYRLKCETASGTAEIHVRYYLAS